MATVTEHYEDHLAQYYSWMFGDFNNIVEANRQFFIVHKLIPGNSKNSKLALDLGAGSGFASIALAEMGYSVIAIDLCQILLDELKCHSGNLDITPIKDDLLNFTAHCPESAGLCVCMGDTLTHLDSFENVKSLFADVYRSLKTGGKFVLSFRDLIFELKGTERFIPVKSDSETIFTCILEYEKEHVIVSDMIYTKNQGLWKLDVSSYRKLRICENNKGMITIIACK